MNDPKLAEQLSTTLPVLKLQTAQKESKFAKVKRLNDFISHVPDSELGT
jgi:hypothetical protein